MASDLQEVCDRLAEGDFADAALDERRSELLERDAQRFAGQADPRAPALPDQHLGDVPLTRALVMHAAAISDVAW
jgi:hypothetical protein